MVLKVGASMGLEIYMGRKDYPVKCQLKQPIYDGIKVIDWVDSDKFIWCRETKPFQTIEEREMNRRKKTTKGTLETIYLKYDEISIDWKIIYDDKEFIIESIEQKDDDKQQVMLRNCVVKTTLNVRC